MARTQLQTRMSAVVLLAVGAGVFRQRRVAAGAAGAAGAAEAPQFAS